MNRDDKTRCAQCGICIGLENRMLYNKESSNFYCVGCGDKLLVGLQTNVNCLIEQLQRPVIKAIIKHGDLIQGSDRYGSHIVRVKLNDEEYKYLRDEKFEVVIKILETKE